jgi:hypothetical protein
MIRPTVSRSVCLGVKHPSVVVGGGARPGFCCCQASCLLMWSAFSDERTGLSFTITDGPRQRNHSRVGVPRDSWPYFTVSDSRPPNLEGQVPIFISPRNRVAQLHPQVLGSIFVASYDFQCYGEGTLTRLKNFLLCLWWLSVLCVIMTAELISTHQLHFALERKKLSYQWRFSLFTTVNTESNVFCDAVQCGRHLPEFQRNMFLSILYMRPLYPENEPFSCLERALFNPEDTLLSLKLIFHTSNVVSNLPWRWKHQIPPKH